MNLMIYLTFLAEIHTTKYNHQAVMILPLLIRENGDTGTAASRPFAHMLAAGQQLYQKITGWLEGHMNKILTQLIQNRSWRHNHAALLHVALRKHCLSIV